MIVGELGCRRCQYVGKMGRTPNGDNLSEKREVHPKRITLSEVRTVGEMGCRRSEVDPSRPISGPAIFSWHFDSHQVLDFIILNHDMQNGQKLMHLEGPKPHFSPF